MELPSESFGTMELLPVPDDEPPPQIELPSDLSTDSLAPLRKRQRQNLQDVSNTKPLAPLRASGRIRIKMTAAAEQKPPDPEQKPTKVLSSSMLNKQRRKSKKLKTDLVSELAIDVKRPSSVLVDTSIRALLTNVAFSQLSPENQKILIESLPLVDRPIALSKENQGIELNPSSINNEFFNRACVEWRDRLSNGEFTNEHQTKLRAEHEREKSKIDPWKARNFEGIWGIKTNGHGVVNVGAMMEKSAMEMKERVEQGDFEIPEGFISEVWKREDDDTDENIKEEDIVESNEEFWKTRSISRSPSQNPSISTSVPTPPETVTSTQLESFDSTDLNSDGANPEGEKYLRPFSDSPVIAEATSSADVTSAIDKQSPEPSFMAEDDYTGDIGSQVELSNDGVPMRWYHQQEHDYLKNEVEPESSGMEDVDDVSLENEGEVVSEITEEYSEPLAFGNTHHIVNNASRLNEASTRINTYDSELPQEIFQKPQDIASTYQTSSGNVLVGNYVQQQDSSLVVRQVIDPVPARFNASVIMQEEQSDRSNYHDNFMMEEAEMEDSRSYHEEIHMNVAKNVKLLAYPSAIKYNDKYIIEESPQNIQQSQHVLPSQPSFRANGNASMQSSYFVGGTNFAYISKIGSKIEAIEPTRIIKHEANNNQGQVKQRIIYEISTEPKISYEPPQAHHVAYATQAHQEVFHQMVKHPNGTTTIYETSAPSTKKTIIQRKKTVDPYTVQVGNNNTIILTPIGSATQQSVQQQQQPQKSIVHIHRTGPPVQFLAAPSPQTFLKKQTIIHPQMNQKPQTNYTAVIRAPSNPPPPQQTIITTVSSKIQRPIQKQKVIMSTSSLQQYRSYNQKPSAGHGSRKQLHPQHIIRPTPSASTTTVIHQQITQEQKHSPIPVILPVGGMSYGCGGPDQVSISKPTFQNDHIIMSSPMSISTSHIPTAPVVIGSPPGIMNNIYVRPKRPQQIFQATHPQLNTSNAIISNSSMSLVNNQQFSTVPPQPRMRHQQNLQRPPPGTVNLERSYQICQAVIQNSTNPNRHQLNNQLNKPSVMGQNKF